MTPFQTAPMMGASPESKPNTRGRADRLARIGSFAVPVIAGLTALVVYLLTIAPSVVVGDSSEFQTIAYTLGISHPTGYPFFTLLGNLFTHLQVGNVAFRVNLMSAIMAALTIAVLAGALILITRNALAALAGALALAFSRTFWAQAVIAEVYSLHLLLVTVTLAFLLVLVGVRRAASSTETTLSRRTLICWLAACLVFGLGLAHHRTIVVIAPAFVIAGLALGRRFYLNARVVGATILAVLAPLAFYLYLPLRWPAVHGVAATPQDLWWLVMGSGYGSALRFDALWTSLDRYALFGRLAEEQFTFVGLALAAIGAAWLAWRQPKSLLVTASAFIVAAAFGLAYFVPDVDVFFLPAHAVLALWIGVGVYALASTAGRLARVRSRAITSVLPVVALALPVVLATGNWPLVDRSQDWQASTWGQRVLRYPIENGALIVADMDRLSSLRYFFGVEARDRRVSAVMPDTESQSLDIIAFNLQAGRPVYLARFLPDIGQRYALSSAGPLVRIRPKQADYPAPVSADGAWSPVPGLSLQGSQFEPALTSDTPEPGDTVGVTLSWLATAKLPGAQIRLSLISDSGHRWYTAPWRAPVQGLYPTFLWVPGERVDDYWEIPLPLSLPPLTYSVQLEVSSPGQDIASTSLGTVRVQARHDSTRVGGLTSLTARAGDALSLEAAGFESPVAAGSISRLTLGWHVERPVAQDYTLRWQFLDSSAQVAGERDTPFYDNEWPTTKWQPGERHLVVVPLAVPGALSAGTYDLRVQMVDGEGRPQPWREGWLGGTTEWLPVGRLTVEPRQAALTNLDNKAILLRCDLGQESLRAGSVLPVRLEWRCASPMTRDYTVFLHVLDSNNRVRAQVDQFPVGGTRPTSQWKQGETLSDAYELLLPPDLPTGEYTLEAGMYLASTMERLPVVNENLEPIADHVILGRVHVLE